MGAFLQKQGRKKYRGLVSMKFIYINEKFLL